MVNFNIQYGDDPIPAPEYASNAGSFIDAATTPEIYLTCYDSIRAGNFDDIKANCGIPFMAIGLVLFGLYILHKL